MNKSPHILFPLALFLLLFLLLPSCGVRKPIPLPPTQEAPQTQAATTAQDTDTTTLSSEKDIPILLGEYTLAYQKDIYGRNMSLEEIKWNRMLLQSNGVYLLYKDSTLIDKGTYTAKPYTKAIKICVEQYKVDWNTGQQSSEIERFEQYYGVWGKSQIRITYYSESDMPTIEYLGTYGYSSDKKFHLFFDIQVGECQHTQWQGSNQIKWIKNV